MTVTRRLSIIPRDRPSQQLGVAIAATLSSDSGVNLPRFRTPLVGRAQEVAEVRQFLVHRDVHLLTLTGPGGVGKSRLAVEIASGLHDGFGDGVFFVSLAPLRAPRLVETAIAQALGLPEKDERSPFERICDDLRAKAVLLVLDNCEHLLPAAPMVADLLRSCPSLRVLATSQTPLRVSMEQTFPVPPLALPNVVTVPRLSELAQTESVALFIARAAVADPEFVLSDQNAADVAAICIGLDGLPLAIELAAARIRLLTPSTLRARLINRLLILSGGPRDQPPRLRSMRDAITWSYDLLTPAERALFRRLTVFTGGFTLEAAEAVGRDLDEPVLDLLASLVDASLVVPHKGNDGESRFSMLETIREFGLEQLMASGETTDMNDRHAAWYLALAERIEPDLYGGRGQPGVLNMVEQERENLRAAFAWLVATGDGEDALRLATALLRFWHTRGHLSEGRDWLERALATADPVPPALRAKALIGVAIVAWPQNDREEAITALDQALALVEGTADREVLALARLVQANIATDLGDLALAAKSALECRTLYEGLGRRWDAAIAGLCLAKVAQVEGDLTRAETLYEENLAVFRDIGDEFGLAMAQFSLGLIRTSQGRPVGALQHHAEAVKGFQILGERLFVAANIESMAVATLLIGQPESAARLLGAAQTLRAKAGTTTFFGDPTALEQATAAARAVLGKVRFDAAWASGATAPLDDVIDEVSQFADLPADWVPAVDIDPARAFGLTTRELDVLRLVVEGYSNPEIATRLFISPRTVRNHLTQIFAKLGVASRTAAATCAVRHDLV